MSNSADLAAAVTAALEKATGSPLIIDMVGSPLNVAFQYGAPRRNPGGVTPGSRG